MAQPPKPRSWKDGFRSFHDFQSVKPISRPNTAETFIPVVGPAWEAASDLEDGHYGAAAFNASMAVLEVIPGAEVLGELGQAGRVMRKVGTAQLSHQNVRRALERLDKIHPGEQMHHVIEMKGASRLEANWKNNPLLLKVLPKETHMRLRGKAGTLKKFKPVEKMWHGTNRVMKAGAVGLLGDVTGAGAAHVSHQAGAPHSHKIR